MVQGQSKRRKVALEGLEKQLESGKKPAKVEGKTSTTTTVDITDGDRSRIQKNIDVLKSRI